ncbi:hypothetical protein PAE2842 [Pyrobaculum aerophilum str. IM2]|uniref:Uncharacterized protein n=2 Tax=Pyrobaculum aerophilum TaxID=13773 RepID=Q8ZUD1_PYRAE|nr:hypothetical protein [Pyrobaculum aerophilum]AAL64476.1 hypothetical protein PAE2842 [Pyrobaculum aerophilum str. IM2]HII47328.1 hypothetical protein [Pyrobaculum aerophilum]
MPSKYARIAVERSIAEEFSLKIRKIGRRPSEVISAVFSAVIDAVDHGYDPLDMIHICRIARNIGIGRAGYEVGVNAGMLLKAYYKPKEFLDIMARIGPQVMGVYRVSPDTFRANDPQVRDTVKGLFAGIGCKSEEWQEFIKVNCD